MPQEKLGDEKLYALVNNAGTVQGMGGCSRQDMIDTNIHGVKLMTEAFESLVEKRICTTGSGGGPGWVSKLTDEAEIKFWSSQEVTWEELMPAFEAKMALIPDDQTFEAYKLTKAVAHKLNEIIARANPNLLVSAVSPGFVATNLSNHNENAITPEQGCVSTIHALFAELSGSGFYYGSDGVRSPLHFMRSPGEPAFEGY